MQLPDLKRADTEDIRVPYARLLSGNQHSTEEDFPRTFDLFIQAVQVRQSFLCTRRELEDRIRNGYATYIGYNSVQHDKPQDRDQ